MNREEFYLECLQKIKESAIMLKNENSVSCVCSRIFELASEAIELKENKEEWRDVLGFEGIYMISSQGRLKKLRSTVERNGMRNVTGMPSRERIISQTKSDGGYVRAALSKDKKIKHTNIHRLVAMAFIENITGYNQVNHINGNKTDNRACNLEWVSSSQNARHAYAAGLIKPRKGENHWNRILTKESVMEIREYAVTYSRKKEMAEKYKVSISTVYSVFNGKNWSMV